jgi:hypothetical protein
MRQLKGLLTAGLSRADAKLLLRVPCPRRKKGKKKKLAD